ncbi:hypothetical protein N9216_01470 [Pseudomonadales bacterium]|nr:hypothetical protein [Pseudomonadales bacterium]
MRPLITSEIQFIKRLTSAGVDLGLMEVTDTGLKKSILDATVPVRQYFSSVGFHEYELQQQGRSAKVIKQCLILDADADADAVIDTELSVYRPDTKQGDPRLWIYQLKRYASANDIIGITVKGDIAYVLNVTVLSRLGTNYLDRPSASRDAFSAVMDESSYTPLFKDD